MNTEEIIQKIGALSELDESEKAGYIAQIERGEDALTVLDRIEDALHAKLDKEFEDAGIVIDENDPEYRAAYEAYLATLDVAKREFETEMAEIARETDRIETETFSTVDAIQADAISAGISGVSDDSGKA